jgi:hypothetical protein
MRKGGGGLTKPRDRTEPEPFRPGLKFEMNHIHIRAKPASDSTVHSINTLGPGWPFLFGFTCSSYTRGNHFVSYAPGTVGPKIPPIVPTYPYCTNCTLYISGLDQVSTPRCT